MLTRLATALVCAMFASTTTAEEASQLARESDIDDTDIAYVDFTIWFQKSWMQESINLNQEEFELWMKEAMKTQGFEVEAIKAHDFDGRGEGLAWFDVASNIRVDWVESIASPGKLVPEYTQISKKLRAIPHTIRAFWYFEIWAFEADFEMRKEFFADLTAPETRREEIKN